MSIEILKVNTKTYETYSEALEHLISQGVKHIGWLNNGISIPKGNYTTIYRNWSGSSTLECDLRTRIAYSVDMGD